MAAPLSVFYHTAKIYHGTFETRIHLLGGHEYSSREPEMTTKKSLVIGVVFGALVFVVAFLGGFAITSAFGPGTSGVITATLTSALVVVAGQLAPRFPTLLTTNLIFAALAIPTSLFGPFGPLKILFGLGTGLIYELCVTVLRRSRISYIVAAGLSAFVSVYLIYYGSSTIVGKVPTNLEKYLHYFAFVYAALGALGGYLGIYLFRRLQNHAVVKRLQEII